MDDITRKSYKALKWSTITEFLAKIVTPLINMILARILAPEAFGVLATITMIISFAEIFVESGFQKFLIQHEFESKTREKQFFSVAFWSNLFFSLFVWGVIIVLRNPIAEFAGSPQLGIPIAITGLTIPIYGIIGVQNSELKKSLNFKALFYVRIISAFLPLIITVPLALFGFDYWALIIGNIAGIFVQSVVLFFLGGYRPTRYFSFADLRYMLKFGVWTLLDGTATWITAWVDVLLVSRHMSDYYLGLYKNTSTTVISLFAIITAALTPVLFSTLSKFQRNQEQFSNFFFRIQNILCLILIPMSIGLFIYRDFGTYIMFGDQWSEASDILGILSITLVIRLLTVSTYSDTYRAKGKFHIPLILQLIDIVIFIPTCILSVREGFWTFVYARSLIQLDLIIPNILLAFFLCGLSPIKALKNVVHPLIATSIMSIVAILLRTINDTLIWNFLSIILCAIVYFVIVSLFKYERETYITPVAKKVGRALGIVPKYEL